MLTNTPSSRDRSAGEGDSTELAFRAFIRAFGLLTNTMEPYFSRFGISGAQWGVLRALRRAEEAGHKGVRMTDLGKRLLVRPPSVTGVVSRLERMGLVERRPLPTDQRVREVGLTGGGRRVLKDVLKHHPRQMAAVLGGLSSEETHELHRLMVRMARHLEDLQAHDSGNNGKSE